MAVIPQGVTNMVTSVFELVITLLTILFIIKLVMIFTNMGGFGGGSKDSKGSKDGKGDKGDKGSKDGKGDGDKDDKKSRKEQWEEELEEGKANPGSISFQIRNIDDKGVAGAQLELWTGKRNDKWLFKSKGKNGLMFRDNSNTDGIVPNNGGQWEGVPSVTYRLRVIYVLGKHEKYKKEKNPNERRGGFKKVADFLDGRRISTFLDGSKVVLKTDITIKPGDNGRKALTLPYYSERKISFEPYIEDLKYDNETLKTKGIINRV